MWGASFLLIAEGLEVFHPAVVTFLRLLFGALALGLVPKARVGVPREAWPRIAVLGIIWMAVPFLLFPVAEQWIDSSLAGMINGAVPLFTALVAAVWARALPSLRQRVALVIGFLGVMAVSLPAARSPDASQLSGALLIVLAVCLYGISLNLAVPLQQRFGPLPVLWRAQLVALLAITPVGAWGARSSSFAWSSLAAMALLGVFGTGLAFVGLTILVGRVGASRGSVAIYFTPVVAVVLGVALRNEQVHPVSVAGAVLILLGAWLTSRREPAANGQPSMRPVS